MRLPRVRFTVRRIMVAVAIVAVVLGLSIEGPGHYSRCRHKSASFERIGGHLGIASERDFAEDRAYGEQLARLADWYIVMADRYRRATWQPWILLWPDPPKPLLGP
jgi:hypothetical protein